MLSLFNKKSKVKEGKQTQADSKSAQQKKKDSPVAALLGTWKKLNSMDRKQAYTWGAVVLVGVLGLLILLSAAGGNQDDFSDFETRGYDLANMPFSSDEAEQYLLASKYPDMKEGNGGMGLYSEEEKEARQEEDAQEAELEDGTSNTSNYREGRYYGGGAGRAGSGARTKVSSLNSASLKGASGSGMSGKFGPSGDFSNFRSQNRGNDRSPAKGPGSGNARTALRQTAMGSRAAAGLKDNKLLNAKKALMGGSVDGSGAFMDDSGAVNLGEAKGLELDTDAPVSSADLSGLDQGVQDARDKAAKDAQNETEENFWAELGKEFLKKVVDIGTNLAESALNNAISEHQQISAIYNGEVANEAAKGNVPPTLGKDGEVTSANQDIFSSFSADQQDRFLTTNKITKGNDGSLSIKNDQGDDVVIGSITNGKLSLEEGQTLHMDTPGGIAERNKINNRAENTWATNNGISKTQIKANRSRGSYGGYGNDNTWTFGQRNNNSGTIQIGGTSYNGYACGNNWCNGGKVIATGNGNGSYTLAN